MTLWQAGRIVLIVVTAAGAAAISQSAVRYGFGVYGRAYLTEDDVDAAITENYALMSGVLKTKFLDDYKAILSDVTQISKSTASRGQAFYLSEQAVARVRRKYADRIGFAPDADIKHLITSSASLLKSIYQKEGYQLCNKVVAVGPIGLGGHIEDYITQLDSEGAMIFEAIYNATHNPTETAEATDLDWGVVEDRLVEMGYPTRYLDLLADENHDDPDYCPAAIALMHAMNATDGEAGRRVRASYIKLVAEN